MLTAAIICLIIAAVTWWQTIKAFHAPTAGENLEFLGVFIFGPVAVITSILAFIFGVIYGISLIG